MIIRWRGRGEPQDQVANALDSTVNLTPVSETRATQTRSNWSALQPGQTVPLIWEDIRHGGEEDEQL